MSKIINALLLLFLFIIASCGSDPAEVDCTKSDLKLEVKQITEASDCSKTDGQLVVNATGGKAPYQYSINGQPMQSSGTFINLSSGKYTVQVMDADQCTREIADVILNASALSVQTTVTPNTKCTGSNGAVKLIVTQGSAPFQYQIGTTPFSSTNIFNDVPQGMNQFTIMDSKGCMIALSVDVPRGPKGTSWTNDILPIVKQSCALSTCHDGTVQVDLRIYSVAKSHAAEMKKFTQDRSMPFDGSLEQSKIDLIACWVDDGALDN